MEALDPIAAMKAADEQISAIHTAFGAPGDHGYDSREGKALFALYRFQLTLQAAIRKAEAAETPDLLTALKGLLQCAGIADAAPEDVDEDDRARERAARAAIATAEGRGVSAISPVSLEIAEARRTIEVKGYTAEHDDLHRGEMAWAAACYATVAADAAAFGRGYTGGRHGKDLEYRLAIPEECRWPLDEVSWNPEDPRRDLVKAAALIVAEIESIDRCSMKLGDQPQVTK